MSAASRELTKSKKRRSRRGGARRNAGRPTNAALPVIAVAQALAHRTGDHFSIPQAVQGIRQGMLRAAGADSDGLDRAGASPASDDTYHQRAEATATNVLRSAYRIVAFGDLVDARADGGFTCSPKTRHPEQPCRCRRAPIPHQHCAQRACKAMSAARAIDPWPIEDRLWGHPEPKTWHCEEHRVVEKACVGVLGSRCSKLVRVLISQQIVRCTDCERRARVAVGAESTRKPSP